MWAKSIVTPVVLIPTLVILQISYGKPTDEVEADVSQNQTIIAAASDLLIIPASNSTDVDLDLDLEVERADVNSSLLLQTVSILLTVLAPNDTTTLLSNDSSSSPIITSMLLHDANNANESTNSTMEPEYYLDEGENDHDHNDTMFSNLTAASSSFFSSTLSDLEEDVVVADNDNDTFDTLSMHVAIVGAAVGATATTDTSPSSPSSSLITEDEMDAAGSVDEVVRVTAASVPSSLESTMRSSNEDDSISEKTNLNVDTVEPPSSHAENEGIGIVDDQKSVEATEQITLHFSTPASIINESTEN